MTSDLKILEDLEESFKQFPSIGSKSAERLAYAVLNMPQDEVDKLIENLKKAKSTIHPCPICGSLTYKDICEICSSKNRDHSVCLVVSEPKDIYSFEKLGSFLGVYHVLGGDINPNKGIIPDKLRIKELIDRIAKENIKELILATSPTLEGQTTALYINKLLENTNVKVSRLAFGLPVGGQFEYIDEMTIGRALEGRTKLK